MTYERFAYVYDFLMQDVPYERWLAFFERHAKSLPGKKVLDVACGTGEFTWRLKETGWDVTGVDLSEDMLMVAQQKAAERGKKIPWFQQDMRMLEGLGTFDAVTIFCDSLNYLLKEEEVKDTFRHVYDHLQAGGLFLFDVHSLYKMEHIFKDGTFTSVDEEVSYIWNCFDGDAEGMVEHELTFFAFDQASGQYERFDELHYQRTYAPEQYADWLEQAGFEIVRLAADFTDNPPQQDSQRIFFVARKG
ncbi:class I SAM-dependent DNA methyltransferase [Bacillus xiapuensis]|uniref:class I SAM-dependent DNA methyltransferase n=1 Tax=Bacillus xiapuensis TaxID=2014075 RepID=UPI000C250751|nr:class I SAM-dependent methyltransferase [Bacillus xiapuensis]